MLAFLDKIPFGTPLLRRILFWLLTAFVTYVLAGFLVVPPVLKSVIVDQCATALHRTGTVERVAFNPLTLRLEIDRLAVAKREGEGNLLSVEKIDASAGLATLWRFAPVISQLKLVGPSLDITFFGDGRYSISDLIGARDETKQPQEEKDKSTAVFPFALYGFEMSNATIVFDDRPHAKRHVISSLDLVVPFTSSFTSLRKEFTEPKFSAVINGDPVELTGRTLPFDTTLRTEFKLGAVNVDLQQYWGYLPVDTPLVLESGRFTSEISLLFERPDAERLNLFLGGGGSLGDLKLRDKAEGTVLSLDKVSFELDKYSLGDNHLSLKDVTLVHPYCKVIRSANDAVNWAGYFPSSSAPAKAPAKTGAAPASANATQATANATQASANATQAAAGAPRDDARTGGAFTLDIRKLTVQGGELDWRDRAVPGGFKRVFRDLTVNCDNLSTRDRHIGSFSGSLGREEQFSVKGSVAISPSPEGNATLTGKKISLPVYAPYYASALPLSLDAGQAGFSATVTFRPDKSGTDVDVVAGDLSLTGLALRKPDAKEPSLTLDELAVSGTTVDLKGRDLTVDRLWLKGPDVKLVREKSGDIDLARVFAAGAGKDEAAPRTAARAGRAKRAGADNAGEAAEPGWTGLIKAVRVTGGAVALRDMAIANPATLAVSDLAVDLDDVTTRAGATIPFHLRADWGRRGRVEAKGKAVLDPLKVSGDLSLNNLGLRRLDGYLAEHTELLFAGGRLGAKLTYDYAAGEPARLAVAGDATVSDVQLRDNRGTGEFAGAKALELRGISLTGEPYRVRVGAINLREPRLAVDIDEKGDSNFRHALRIPQAEPETPDQAAAKAEKGKAAKPAAKPEPAAAPETEPAEGAGEDVVSIGRVTMTGGAVRFHDASVKPAYTSVISEMQLVAADLRQTPDAKPKLDFKGKFGPTQVTVLGTCNPLVSPPHIDLAISVNGMEMVPLTPYTLSYLAYPVEKGRLYADVKFKTDQWELKADNKFFIEQLVLGPKDKRPGAPNVPVQFGLSLLQDSKGDMQLDLPIRGRLDDPDFRIGAIVFKAIVNLFFKALASPFSLIGSIFGGGDGGNMDFVVFEPGYSDLGDKAREKLDTIIKALTARAKLKLEVDGVVDPDADRKGLVKAIFERKVRQQKYDDLPRKERAATTVDQIRVAPEEYEEYLFDAYRDEDDPEDVRPTTLFAVDRQPVDVMEKFIMDRIQVTDADLEELSVARARAVKDYVIAKAPALTERVFLLDRRKDRKGKVGVPLHRADLGIK